jgi:hypothetical protein
VMGELIGALDSDDPRRREWASEKIMSSYVAGSSVSPRAAWDWGGRVVWFDRL